MSQVTVTKGPEAMAGSLPSQCSASGTVPPRHTARTVLAHSAPPTTRPSVGLSHHQYALWGRERVGPAPGDEELVIEDTVVLVGDLFVDDVLILGIGHHHQILEGVVKVPAVVHVHVSGATEPPAVGHVGQAVELDHM